jgi:hypothetical protein
MGVIRKLLRAALCVRLANTARRDKDMPARYNNQAATLVIATTVLTTMCCVATHSYD